MSKTVTELESDAREDEMDQAIPVKVEYYDPSDAFHAIVSWDGETFTWLNHPLLKTKGEDK